MSELLALLEGLTEPALGCTEPGAVALAAAAACRAVGGRIVRLAVTVDSNVFKNAMAVRIPCYDRTGAAAAAALGAAGGDPSLRLQVLGSITPADACEADRLLDGGAVELTVREKVGHLYVEVVAETTKGVGRAVLDGDHSRFALLQRNGEELDLAAVEARSSRTTSGIGDMSLDTMLQMVAAISPEEVEFVMKGAAMNRAVAEQGLNGRMGMGVGAALKDLVDKGWYPNDAATRVRIFTAAGADARMAGCPMPVMNSSGSGNQGIIITLSILALGEARGYTREQIARAIALAHMVSAKIKAHTGKLSAVCGCAVAAATGAAAGMTLLLEGDLWTVETAVINMLGDVTGEICDGAKEGCALKLATASAAALQAALLAKSGVRIPVTNGIVGHDASETIYNVGRISNPGMIDTDRVILQVMRDKAAVRPA